MKIITDITEVSEVLNVTDLTTKEEAVFIINKLKDILNTSTIKAISAPQIGINKQIFCINFNGVIKAFIDPVITKKLKQQPVIETLAGFDTKEYLVVRPTEIQAVYFTEDLKYEDNKFLGAAAALFDQQCQLLAGVLPSEIGLESDVIKDGKLEDLTEDELKEAVEMLKQITSIRLSKQEEEINSNKLTANIYKNMRFAENVMDETVQVITDSPKMNREQRRAVAKKAKHGGKKNGK